MTITSTSLWTEVNEAPVKPTATIRTLPEDFRVEELPMYPASGTGGHVFIQVRKTGWSTSACVGRIAKELNLDSSEMGHAGMKDRHAITTQLLSFPWPEQEPLPSLDALEPEGIEVLSAERHPHKLRVGHLIGNRFEIVLRDLADDNEAPLADALTQLRSTGVPNAFGPQRFGRDGDNPERALGWLRGEHRGPRDKRTRKLLLSSVQSMLFDRLLARRVADGTWSTVVRGDLAKTTDHGGLFLSEDEEVDAKRAALGEVTATGPIFGPRMRWPEGEPARWEREVLDEALGGPDALEGLGKIGAGSRRALRIVPGDLEFLFAKEVNQKTITVCMTLPKGAYATTVLGAVFLLQDESIRRWEASKNETTPDSSPHDELLRDTRNTSR